MNEEVERGIQRYPKTTVRVIAALCSIVTVWSGAWLTKMYGDVQALERRLDERIGIAERRVGAMETSAAVTQNDIRHIKEQVDYIRGLLDAARMRSSVVTPQRSAPGRAPGREETRFASERETSRISRSGSRQHVAPRTEIPLEIELQAPAPLVEPTGPSNFAAPDGAGRPRPNQGP
jgi:hypothetical protein